MKNLLLIFISFTICLFEAHASHITLKGKISPGMTIAARVSYLGKSQLPQCKKFSAEYTHEDFKMKKSGAEHYQLPIEIKTKPHGPCKLEHAGSLSLYFSMDPLPKGDNQYFGDAFTTTDQTNVPFLNELKKIECQSSKRENQNWFKCESRFKAYYFRLDFKRDQEINLDLLSH